MDVLPLELQTEILLRLSATTLATTARQVCRLWHSIISDPIFVKDQLIRSIDDNNNTTLLYHRNRSNHNEGLVMYSSTGDLTLIGPKGILPEERVAYKPITLVCNGLVLYIYLEHGIIKFNLCNPVLNQCVPLQPIRPPLGIRVRFEPLETMYRNWGFGFGFDPITNRYKVIVISRSTNPRSTTSDVCCCTVDVVSEKKKKKTTISSWRRLGCLNHTVGEEEPSGVFFNGRLHWPLSDNTDGLFLSVDLNTEEFSFLIPRMIRWWNFWMDNCRLKNMINRFFVVDTIDHEKENRKFFFVSAFVPCLLPLLPCGTQEG